MSLEQPSESENGEVIKELEEKISPLLNEIASFYTRSPKITLIVRCPWLVDGDLVMSNDEDPQTACNSMMNLYRRSHSEKLNQCCDLCRCPNDCGQPGAHCRWIKDGKPNHFCHMPSGEAKECKCDHLDYEHIDPKEYNESPCSQCACKEFINKAPTIK